MAPNQILDFPLWHMGISGYEVMVMCTISPFLLCIRSLRSLAVKNVRIVNLLSTAGLMAYLVPSPEYRLFAVGFGVSSTCLAWSATWYAERSQPARVNARVLAWTSGLVMSSVAKFACYTNNPVWPVMHAENGGWNKLGLSIAILAALRSSPRAFESGNMLEPPSPPTKSPLMAALGLGGLFFGLHSLLSDSSTMILWVWEGFPVRGPIAANGAMTITAMGLGLLLSTMIRGNTATYLNLSLVAAGATLVTSFSHWTGYIGALMLATSLCSSAPILVSSAVRQGPLSFGLGFLVYNFMVLAHVWVVAYAFVPGGPLLRERTNWIMTAMVIFISAGLRIAVDPQSLKSSKQKPPRPAVHRFLSYRMYITGFLQLLAIATAYIRFPTNDYVPHHKEEKLITAGIWTIHFSLDNDMWSSEHRIRDLVKELEVDVIGFLESDLQRIIMGNRDTTQFIAEDLGMYVDFGPGPNKHTWGAALLSKFPILNSTHHLLPSPVGELAPAIHATLDAYGEMIDVVVFHSGQEEDPEDRRLQSEYLSKLMKESPRPLILMSYLVIKPGEGNYHTYVGEKSGMKDIDPSDWDRWCEYILYKGIRRTGYARVSRSTITDTELQVSPSTSITRPMHR